MDKACFEKLIDVSMGLSQESLEKLWADKVYTLGYSWIMWYVSNIGPACNSFGEPIERDINMLYETLDKNGYFKNQ